MNPMPIAEFAERCGARISGDAAREVLGISKDTRSLRRGEIYLALKGENFDGHDFLQQAEQAGACGVLVESGSKASPELGIPRLEVENSLAALHRLAASWRSELGARVVCLTGSSGKTSTKEFVASVLSRAGRVNVTAGNLNNHIGLPLSILSADREDEFAVWEIGMNHPGEIAPLAALAAPDVSIVTNVGTAHIEFFADRSGIAQEKSELISALKKVGLAIFPASDDFAALLAEAAPCRVQMVGFSQGDPHVESLESLEDGIRFQLCAYGESYPVHLQTPGVHMGQNALLAAAVGLHFGVSLQCIAEGLSSVAPMSGRLQFKKLGASTLLDDTYNANPDSVIAALRTLDGVPRGEGGRRIAVLGRMGELGHYADAGYKRVGEFASRNTDLLVVVGEEASRLVDSAQRSGLREVFHVSDCSGAAVLLRSVLRPADVVLLKGSRSSRMEEILKYF